jgi:hypothetical protein
MGDREGRETFAHQDASHFIDGQEHAPNFLSEEAQKAGEAVKKLGEVTLRSNIGRITRFE